MKKEDFLVSIIIPCRNEEGFIKDCLDSILTQDFNKENLEVLVIDGMSDDRTREIVKNSSREHPLVKLIDNPEKVTPKGMNLGVKSSKGDVIIFLNSHSTLDREFLKWTIYYLKNKPEVMAVGGRSITITKGERNISKTITLVLDSVFGSGGIRYRQRKKEGFIKDTLPFAAYRRDFFKKVGYMDEDLLRGQDAELNLRILKLGGKIYFSPKIKSYLHARSSLKKFLRQQFQYGYFKVKIAQKLGFKSIFRQVIPSVFVLSLFFSGILALFSKAFLVIFLIISGFYFLLDLIFSFQLGLKNGLKYILPAVFVFFVFHFTYGLGFLVGTFHFFLLRKKIKKDIGITR